VANDNRRNTLIVENKAQEHAIENESALPLLRRHHETNVTFTVKVAVGVYFKVKENI